MASEMSSSDGQPGSPSCTRAISRKGTHSLPQTIAHRGYKAAYPENTMASFRGAVKAGAHALETDIHITSDSVVVLSHDAGLSRCYGQPGKIMDHTWAHISTLRTVAAPHEPMPRLIDLLTYLAEPDNEDIWLLLDIKSDNPAETVMRDIAAALASVPALPGRPWNTRVVMGLWSTRLLPYAKQFVPEYAISHIGFSMTYAKKFFPVAGAGFNMLFDTLTRPDSYWFVKRVRAEGRPLITWTVNDPAKMKWCIRKRLDGVITDDPALFRKVCDEYDDSEPPEWWSVREIYKTARMWFMVLVFGKAVLRKVHTGKGLM